MKALILGMSSLVSRRVLTAMHTAAGIDVVEVASEHLDVDAAPDGIQRFYNSYESALQQSDAELVYVSLINSVHEHWAQESLKSGRHTVIDKPACLDLKGTRQLLELADRKSLGIAESTVFSSHPQFDELSLLENDIGPLTRVYAAFSFPPLAEDDFRLSSSLGGGAFLDLGPYAAGAARHFFGPFPDRVHCDVLTRHPRSGVETAFSVSFVYPDGRSLVGQFGFDTEYQNCLQGIGPSWSFRLDRAFTTTPDLRNRIHIRQANKPREITVDPEDSFKRFLEEFQTAIAANDAKQFRESMLNDAILRDRLILAAEYSQ